MGILIRVIFREGEPKANRCGSQARCNTPARRRGLTLWRDHGDVVFVTAYRPVPERDGLGQTQPATLILVNFAPQAQSKRCLTAVTDNLPVPIHLPGF